MIKVSYNHGCRLGNHLFLYAAGRLLARRLELALEAEAIDGFSRTKDIINGKIIKEPIEILNSADPIPLWPEVNNLVDKKLEITQGFVNSRYFIKDRDIIKTWLATNHSMQVDEDDVLINIRLGDFIPFGLVLDPIYYTYILERIKFKKLYLMTDDPNHEYLNCIKKYNPILIPGYGIEHFRKAISFKRIIMSNSTFCWWFTFVSDAHEIYFPMINGNRCGSWCLSHLPSIDLRLDLPEVTHVYNIPNLDSCWKPPGPTDEEKEEAIAFSKQSRVLFLP